jgi:hypothetical protein
MELSSSPALPSPSASRFGHTCSLISAHDSAWGIELAVVFAGVKRRDAIASDEDPQQPGDDVYIAANELTVLDIEGDRWFSPKSSNIPSPRAFTCSATVGKTIWFFGGHVLHHDTSSGAATRKKTRAFYSDLFSLDTDSWQFTLEWTQASDTKGPSKRDMATLTSVGGGKLVLLGGRGETGRTLNDLWLFDIHEKRWTQVKPPLPHPPPRKLHGAVSIGGGRLLVYGGEKDLGGALDDMWTLRGLDADESSPIRWTPIRLKPSPGPRFGHTLSFLTTPHSLGISRGERLEEEGQVGASVLLWGGSLSHSEAWCLSLASFKWNKVETAPGPTARLCHTLIPLSLSLSPTSQGEEVDADSLSSPLASFRLLLVGGRGNQGLVGIEEAVWMLIARPIALAPPSHQDPSEESASVISSVFGSAAAPVNLFRSLMTFPPLLSAPKPSAPATGQKHEISEPRNQPRNTDEILTPLEPGEDSYLGNEASKSSPFQKLLDRIARSSASEPPLNSPLLNLDHDYFKIGSVGLLIDQVNSKRKAMQREIMRKRHSDVKISLHTILRDIDQASHHIPRDHSSITMGEVKALMDELAGVQGLQRPGPSGSQGAEPRVRN